MSTDADRELVDFAARLRSAREDAGLTQLAACEAMGVTTTQLSNWERGKSAPHLDDLAKVAKFLGVSAHWLIFGEGPRGDDLLALAAVSTEEAPAEALAAALRRMSADELQRLADAKRADELAAWDDPIRRGIAALEEALGANPPLPLRDEINRSIERMRRDLQRGSDGVPDAGASVRYHSGPQRRHGYVEEREVEYRRPDDPDEDRPGRKRGGA